MSVTALIPLVVKLLDLSFKIGDVIEKSKDINPNDKLALRALIKKAKDGVTYIDGTDKGDT